MLKRIGLTLGYVRNKQLQEKSLSPNLEKDFYSYLYSVFSIKPYNNFCRFSFLAVTAIFLYKAAAVCTLLICRIRLVSAYDDFIKHTITLLVVVILAGEN